MRKAATLLLLLGVLPALTTRSFLTGQSQTTINVTTQANQPPDLTLSSTVGCRTVKVNGQATSYTPGGGITGILWSWGDGTQEDVGYYVYLETRLISASHTYANDTTYTITVTVYDFNGLSKSQSLNVVIACEQLELAELQHGLNRGLVSLVPVAFFMMALFAITVGLIIYDIKHNTPKKS